MDNVDQVDALFRAMRHRFAKYIKGLFYQKTDTPGSGKPLAAYILEDDKDIMLVSIKIVFLKKPTTLEMVAFTHYLNKTYAKTFTWIDFTPGSPALLSLMTRCGWRLMDKRVVLDLGVDKNFTVPAQMAHWQLDIAVSFGEEKRDIFDRICGEEYWSPVGGLLDVSVSGVDFRYWFFKGYLSPEKNKPSALMYGIMTPLGTFYIFQSFMLKFHWDNNNIYAIFHKARDSLKKAYEKQYRPPENYRAELAIWSEDFLKDSDIDRLLLTTMYKGDGFKILHVDDFEGQLLK